MFGQNGVSLGRLYSSPHQLKTKQKQNKNKKRQSWDPSGKTFWIRAWQTNPRHREEVTEDIHAW